MVSEEDEWIARLAALVTAPPPCADLPGLSGMLGLAHLKRYDIGGEPADLDTAVDALERAVTTAEAHPDAALWHWQLGLALAARAKLGHGSKDHDGAVSHLTVAYRRWPTDDTDRDDVAMDLGEAVWDRFLARRADSVLPPETAAADADEALGTLRDIHLVSTSSDHAAHLAVVRGMALLARYDHAGRCTEDLTRGVAELTAALDALPVDIESRYATAAADLACGHLELAGLQRDRAHVEIAASAARRALGPCDPGTPGWISLHRALAAAHEALWELDGNAADLGVAISGWRTVQEADPDPAVAVRLADLLRQEAVATGDLKGLTEAGAVLAEALSSTDDRGPVWRALGETHLLCWQLARAPEALRNAIGCADDAVAALGRADDDLLAAHILRVVVGYELLTYHDPQAGAVYLRTALNDADEALTDRVGADAERRVALAAIVLYGEFAYFGETQAEIDVAKLRRLLALGRSTGPPPEGIAGALDAAAGLLDQYLHATGAEPEAGAGVEAVVRAGRDARLARTEGARLRVLLYHALYTRAATTGDLRAFGAAMDLAERSADVLPDEGEPGVGLPAAAMLMGAAGRGAGGDLDGMRETIGRINAYVPDRTLEPMVRALRTAAALASGDRPAAALPPRPLPPGELPYQSVADAIITAIPQVSVAALHGDGRMLRLWADHLSDLAERLPRGHVARTVSWKLAAQAELGLGSRGAAARAADHLGVAVAECGGPENPLWTDLTRDHARALRLAGGTDRERTRRLGLAALAGHARRVLLQAGTDHALEAAREATVDAATVLRWCLQDQADDDAIVALDAGRGLVLHAATESRTVADVLDEVGRSDLADEWRRTEGLGRDQVTGRPLDAVAAADEVPDDLRTRVLRVLDAAGHDPVAQVRVEDLRAALIDVGADAIVYLVPAAGAVPGFAAVVPARSATFLVELPQLLVTPGSPLRRLLTAGLGPVAAGPLRDAGPVGSTGSVMSGSPLDDLCRWAWRAAMAEVVTIGRDLRAAGPARLVMVPMGILGLVPWHAAYRETSSGRRYAVQDVVVSYTPSARLLCASSTKPPTSTRSALVVGDPLGDLPFAGAEARAVHHRFHPQGRYLGGPSEGPDSLARPDEVLAWMRTASGPAVLHLACHGRVDPARPADSSLVLAGGELPARHLLDASRRAALELGQVFLAACTTSLIGGLHDEAFSLATAFLAAGARTVFGALWSVPDVGTSLLMYLVHHHLHVDGCQPAEALHRAQLWMLDADRVPPPEMPVELASQCSRADLAQPLAWAAFIHLGR
ncbi:CHAT domain-containing protein [Micromonospora sp. HB375]|uniref:CHAT domain-containing protein n=1 Tax=Micromonospora sp. HB375 TaxID=767364 RepID=UPI001AE7B6AD|nr:CHAT domain-containing protein [Micromonospora sp. HB375]MDH6469006.1 hypothetical protein [Micromonospora sp. H404/HB375]